MCTQVKYSQVFELNELSIVRDSTDVTIGGMILLYSNWIGVYEWDEEKTYNAFS